MSQENVEVVRRMYEAFHSGDAEGALAHFDPEVVVDATMRVDAGIGHGREELSAIISRWLAALPGVCRLDPIRPRQGKRNRDGDSLRSALSGTREQDHPHDPVPRARHRPRSRRAAGVGDGDRERRSFSDGVGSGLRVRGSHRAGGMGSRGTAAAAVSTHALTSASRGSVLAHLASGYRHLRVCFRRLQPGVGPGERLSGVVRLPDASERWVQNDKPSFLRPAPG